MCANTLNSFDLQTPSHGRGHRFNPCRAHHFVGLFEAPLSRTRQQPAEQSKSRRGQDVEARSARVLRAFAVGLTPYTRHQFQSGLKRPAAHVSPIPDWTCRGSAGDAAHRQADSFPAMPEPARSGRCPLHPSYRPKQRPYGGDDARSRAIEKTTPTNRLDASRRPTHQINRGHCDRVDPLTLKRAAISKNQHANSARIFSRTR
jgi:hypothetical protein